MQEILPFTSIDRSTYENGTVNRYAIAKCRQDQEILKNIVEIKKDHPNFGYRSITNELHELGYLVNHKRVLRLMNENNLTCKNLSVSNKYDKYEVTRHDS